MKDNTSSTYRDIEYRLLEIFKECAISNDFTRLSQWLEDSIFFRKSRYCAERPISRDDLLFYLSTLFNVADIKDKGIKYDINNGGYALNLLLPAIDDIEELDYVIRIEIDGCRISTLWMMENLNILFPTSKVWILNAIAKNWENYNVLYIENFLHKNFKYELYGKEEIFGCHILSKRQFLIWIECRFECIKHHRSELRVSAIDDGLKMKLNNSSRFIIMKFVDGKIIEAKETDGTHHSQFIIK